MAVTLIRASGLVKRFGATLALRGVDAELWPGLTVVEGANGSGKSTLLGILGGVIRATSGKVAYEPLQEGADVRAELGWVSHDSLAYADLTGRQNIALAAESHGLDPEEVWAEVQERFGIGVFAERKLRTNSRGQRQRIALARALVHGPSVVLLDEPTTGLDLEGVERLLEVVSAEVTAGAVVVVVTHEPQLFAPMDPRRLVLERGRVVDPGD